jgi:hypothetical protein
LTLLIPLLLFLISTHFETIVTKSALHDVILTRCTFDDFPRAHDPCRDAAR